MERRVAGRRTFVAGAVCLTVFGAVHSLAVINALLGAPPDAEAARIQAELQGYTQRMGPFEPSMWGAIQLLNASFSLFAIWGGVLSLVVQRPLARAGLLGRLAGVNTLFSGLLFALTAASRFPPPMVFALATWILFLVAWLRATPPDALLPTDDAA